MRPEVLPRKGLYDQYQSCMRLSKSTLSTTLVIGLDSGKLEQSTRRFPPSIEGHLHRSRPRCLWCGLSTSQTLIRAGAASAPGPSQSRCLRYGIQRSRMQASRAALASLQSDARADKRTSQQCHVKNQSRPHFCNSKQFINIVGV